MAQMLSEKYSVNVHLNTVKRHIRLSRQIPGAEPLITAIEPFYTDLQAKAAANYSAKEDCEIKRDMLALKDTMLDDKVRDLSEACKKYDRDNPGSLVTSLLFPEGVSQVIFAPVESETTEVGKLIVGLQNLGREHALSTHMIPLQTAVGAVKTAIAELYTAIEAQKTAEASESISKVKLSRQYEQNFYAAGSKFGKAYASRLFPALRKPSKKDEEDENTGEVKQIS
jgi:hypothetical protein